MSLTTYSCRNYAFSCDTAANEWRLDALDGHGPFLTARSALLLSPVIPGTWFAPHFNYNVPVIPEFIRRVKRIGGIVQIGKVLSPDVTPELLAEMRDLLRDAG